MVKAVFFDLGGTLLVMRRDKILQKAMHDEGHDLDLKQIHASYNKMEGFWMEQYSSTHATGSDATEMYKGLNAMVIEDLSLASSPAEVARLSALVRSRWEELGSTMPPELYPDVEPVLSRLMSQGLSLGLVSNAPADTARTVEQLGLGRYIRNVVISGIVGFAKPNPEIFRIALAKASVSPDQTIHVGDIYAADVVGARNAGIRGVLLDRERVAGEADCPRIHSLDEVLQLVAPYR